MISEPLNAERLAWLESSRADLLAACKAVVEEDGFRGSALMRKRIYEMQAAIAKAEPHIHEPRGDGMPHCRRCGFVEAHPVHTTPLAETLRASIADVQERGA